MANFELDTIRATFFMSGQSDNARKKFLREILQNFESDPQAGLKSHDIKINDSNPEELKTVLDALYEQGFLAKRTDFPSSAIFNNDTFLITHDGEKLLEALQNKNPVQNHEDGLDTEYTVL
tara:strand:+ start:354 stop:716 length:363 start_codon:yes stop_codon:yes gene_type:complete